MEINVNGEFLAQLLTTNEEEKTEFLASLKNAEGDLLQGDELKAVITPYSTKLRSHFKKEGVGQATRTINTKWEKAIQVDGFTPTKQGIERIGEYLDYMKSKIEPKTIEVTKDLTPEELLKNTDVQNLISQRVTAATAKKQEEFDALKSQMEIQRQQRIDDRVRKEIESVAIAAKIQLGDDEETKRDRLDTLFLKAKAKANGFKIESDKIIPLGDNNAPLQDPTYFNEISFRDFIVNSVNGKMFPVGITDKSKDSPQLNNQSQSKSTLNVKFKDQEDYMNQRRNAKTKEEKIELYDAWKKQQDAA